MKRLLFVLACTTVVALHADGGCNRCGCSRPPQPAKPPVSGVVKNQGQNQPVVAPQQVSPNSK